MSLCEMSFPQALGYVNAWAVTLSAIVTSVATVALYRATTGLMREAEAYQRGFDQAQRDHAPRIDRGLYLALADDEPVSQRTDTP